VPLRRLLKAVLPPRIVSALRALRADHSLLGMTGIAEQKFYADCARSLLDSPGAIVDLGSWMGSTCIALARGLGTAQGTIFAFDRFIWESWMDRDDRDMFCDYIPGENFLPEVRRRIRPFRDRITLIQADLTSYVWDRGDIKLLLVDAMKSPDLAVAIARSFYPSLRPGAILIHQDFKHYYTPWIHILQHRLRSSFKLLRNVAEGGTVAFTVAKAVSQSDVLLASDLSSIDDAEADAAFAWSLELVGDVGRPAIAAAHIMHFVHRREPDKASARLAGYKDPSFIADTDFALALEAAKALGSRNLHPSIA